MYIFKGIVKEHVCITHRQRGDGQREAGSGLGGGGQMQGRGRGAGRREMGTSVVVSTVK